MSVIAIVLIIFVLLLVVAVGHHAIAIFVAHLFHPGMLLALVAFFLIGIALLALIGSVLVAPHALVRAPNAAVEITPVQVSVPPPPPGYSPTTTAYATDAASSSTKLGALMLVILLPAAVIAAFLLGGRFRGQIAFRAGAAMLGVAALVVLFFGFFSFHESAQVAWHNQAMQSIRLADNGNGSQRSSSAIAVADSSSTTKQRSSANKKSKADKSAATEKTPANAEPAAGDESASPKKPDSAAADSSPTDQALPEWVNQPPHRKGDTWIAVVELEPNTNPSVRDEMLDEKITLAANQCIDEHVYRHSNVSKIVQLDPEFLRVNYLKEYYPASGVQAPGDYLYGRLEFDKNFSDAVESSARHYIAVGRLNQLASVSLAGLLLLGGLYLYLRKTTPKVPSALAA